MTSDKDYERVIGGIIAIAEGTQGIVGGTIGVVSHSVETQGQSALQPKLSVVDSLIKNAILTAIEKTGEVIGYGVMNFVNIIIE